MLSLFLSNVQRVKKPILDQSSIIKKKLIHVVPVKVWQKLPGNHVIHNVIAECKPSGIWGKIIVVENLLCINVQEVVFLRFFLLLIHLFLLFFRFIRLGDLNLLYLPVIEITNITSVSLTEANVLIFVGILIFGCLI